VAALGRPDAPAQLLTALFGRGARRISKTMLAQFGQRYKRAKTPHFPEVAVCSGSLHHAIWRTRWDRMEVRCEARHACGGCSAPHGHTIDAMIAAAQAGLGLTNVLSYKSAEALAGGRLVRVLPDNATSGARQFALRRRPCGDAGGPGFHRGDARACKARRLRMNADTPSLVLRLKLLYLPLFISSGTGRQPSLIRTLPLVVCQQTPNSISPSRGCRGRESSRSWARTTRRI
jgi:hypothetical protein